MAKETKKPGVAPDTAPAPGAVATYDWSQAPTGFEDTSASDMGIPYLAILHAQSPQVNKADKNYPTKGIEGAGAGDIINTLANKVVYVQGRDPLEFIPCYHRRLYVEWTPRNQGGGLVKVHQNAAILQECKRNDDGQDVLRNGNIIVTTHYFYGLAVIAGEPTACIIGMSSTQTKKAKAWLNQMAAIQFEGPNGKYPAPMFSHAYHLSTVPESNESGSWFGWKITMKGQLSDQNLIKAAIAANKEAHAARAALPAPSEETNGNEVKPPPFA